jgi:hypothetical protein
MTERPAPNMSTLIGFALVVALMWVPFGVDICGSDQSCLSWVAGVPFEPVITAAIVFTHYAALFTLVGTIVPAKWLTFATFILTLTLTGWSPWSPAWLLLAAGCSALAALAGNRSPRPKPTPLSGLGLAAVAFGVYWVTGLGVPVLPVNGPLVAVALLAVWALRMKPRPRPSALPADT